MAEIRRTARRSRDGAIESEQRLRLARPLVPETDAGALALARAYWGEVERCTLGLVRAHETGTTVELRLLRGPTLLVLGPGESTVEPGLVAYRYPVAGGLLARSASGALRLAQETRSSIEMTSSVTDYFPRLDAPPGAPRWTGALYGSVQARIHDAVGRRFLTRLAEAAEG